MLLSNDRGFTLVELMVTIAIVVIILGLSIPSLSHLGNRFRLKGAGNECYATLQQARMEAMRSASSFTIVFEQPINSTNYDLVLFRDANNNCSFDPGEQVVSRINLGNAGSSLGISANSFSTNGDGLNAVRFNPRGFPRDSGGGFSAGRVTIRDSSTGHTVSVDVSPLGEIHVEQIS
jgi:type IV fimbrial biogenesis protein FimT